MTCGWHSSDFLEVACICSLLHWSSFSSSLFASASIRFHDVQDSRCSLHGSLARSSRNGTEGGSALSHCSPATPRTVALESMTEIMSWGKSACNWIMCRFSLLQNANENSCRTKSVQRTFSASSKGNGRADNFQRKRAMLKSNWTIWNEYSSHI